MTTSVINQVAYLRTSRDFPEEQPQLSVEIDKSYIDIANNINVRTIGIFPVRVPAINGEGWFINQNKKQQGFRQVYDFTSATTFPIPHGLNLQFIERFTRLWGTYTDAAGNWYGILGATSVPIAGQFTFYITATNIVFLPGAGAPFMVRGSVVLEWISQP